MFIKYQHVERVGTDEVEGIENGVCYIFPKIDGTNGSIWPENDILQFGSRNRHLNINGVDNQGIMESLKDNEKLKEFFKVYPDTRLFGEWLVPHTLKTYRQDAWRKFYVFDVCKNNEDGELEYIPFDDYSIALDCIGIDYIPPIQIVKNPSYEFFLRQLKSNEYLIEDGKGVGEGIVIKNYGFRNSFGRTVWAKMVRTEFKEKNRREFGTNTTECKPVECNIVNEYITQAFVDKELVKLKAEKEGWSSKYISELLGRVFYEFINEELWHILKKFKQPTINFKRLNTQVILKIKELLPDVF